MRKPLPHPAPSPGAVGARRRGQHRESHSGMCRPQPARGGSRGTGKTRRPKGPPEDAPILTTATGQVAAPQRGLATGVDEFTRFVARVHHNNPLGIIASREWRPGLPPVSLAGVCPPGARTSAPPPADRRGTRLRRSPTKIGRARSAYCDRRTGGRPGNVRVGPRTSRVWPRTVARAPKPRPPPPLRARNGGHSRCHPP